MTAPDIPLPVADRECGGCNVCCVVLTINDPALKKVQGVRCHNALPDNRCAIYDHRPQTCIDFLCGWRLFRWVRPGLRPDTSGVLIRPRRQVLDGVNRMTIAMTLLSEAGLEADGVAETLAAAVGAGTPVFLEVLGRPSHTHPTARVDNLFADYVRQRDKSGLLSLLRYLWTQAQTQMHQAVPVTIGPEPASSAG